MEEALASQGFESPYLQTPPPRLGSERLRLAGREASDFAINIPTRYAGAIRTWRSTPSLHAARIRGRGRERSAL
jgi:hypothetical protein